MTSDTDVANRALALAQARSSIANFQERSEEARLINLFYTETRDAMMRGAHWNFTRRMAQLTILKAAPGTPENASAGGAWTPAYPPLPWLYSYAYPSDCLLMRYISPLMYPASITGGTTTIFSVPALAAMPDYIALRPQKFLVSSDTDANGNQVKAVLSNQDQALGIYTQRVTNPDLWDPSFMSAFESALASRLVIPISGDKGLAKLQAQSAMDTLLQARISDGNEGLSTEEWIPDWIRARGYAGDWTYPSNSFVGSFTTPGFLAI